MNQRLKLWQTFEYSVLKIKKVNYRELDKSMAGIASKPKCGRHPHYPSCDPSLPNNWKTLSSAKLAWKKINDQDRAVSREVPRLENLLLLR